MPSLLREHWCPRHAVNGGMFSGLFAFAPTLQSWSVHISCNYHNGASMKICFRSTFLSFPSPVSRVVGTSLDVNSVLSTYPLPVMHPEIGNKPRH
jgi:hypothetical protein